MTSILSLLALVALLGTVTISQGVTDVRAIPRQGLNGQRTMVSDLDRTKTLINKNPQAADVWTLAITRATTGTVYTWTLNGVVQTYTQLSSDSTVTILAASIAAYINQQPLTGGQVRATSSVGDLILTGTWPGVAITITESDSNIGTPSHTTTAASASAVSFGRAIVKTPAADFATSVQPEQYGAAAATALFTAQVGTLVVDYAAGEVYTVTITHADLLGNRKPYSVSVTADTDDTTTAAAIVTALNAMLPANTVLAASTGDTITLTEEIVGEEFQISLGLKSGTTARLAYTATTGPSLATSFNRAFAGVSLWRLDEQIYPVNGTGIGGVTGGYPANAGMEVLSRGQVWTDNSQTLADGDPVYVELGSTNNAQFFNTASSTRALVDGAKWVRGPFSAASADAIGVLELNVPFA